MFALSPRNPSPAIVLLILSLNSIPLQAQPPRQVNLDIPGVVMEQLAQNLGIPWGMTFLSANRLLFSERAGHLKILDLNDLGITRLNAVPAVAAIGQGGMLDVAVGPDYARDGWIYITYSKAVTSGAATTLARTRITKNQVSDWQDLLVTDSASDGGRHFGSRITFDDQGHVFFGVGDRGKRDPAQDLSNHMGSIMRLNLDGSIPGDNPFVGQPTARDEIWSYGHRNPQGLYYDRARQRLWSIEHGPRGGDEINLIHRGLNYGWPVISHGKEYWGPVSIGEGTSKAGMEQPLKVYIPSIAPASLILYSGEAFPQWRGNLFAGALKLEHLNRVTLSGPGKPVGEERLLEAFDERIRALLESAEGWIYLSTDSGKILRLRPAP